MIPYAQLCAALAGAPAGAVPMPVPAATSAPTPVAAAPAAPAYHEPAELSENTITNLNVAAASDGDAEMEIGEEEIADEE